MSTRAFKDEKISEIKEKVDKAQVAIVTEYRGMTVEEITKLRREIQKNGGDYMVTKNTLAKIAIGFDDPVIPAKALSKFMKDVKKGEIIGAALDGKLLSAEETKALAALPSKEEIYAKMLGSINSPASGIVGSINAVMAQLTRAMAAVRDQKAA